MIVIGHHDILIFVKYFPDFFVTLLSWFVDFSWPCKLHSYFAELHLFQTESGLLGEKWGQITGELFVTKLDKLRMG